MAMIMVTSEDGGVTTPGPLTYNLSGNTLTLTTGELLASTTDGNTSGGTANSISGFVPAG